MTILHALQLRYVRWTVRHLYGSPMQHVIRGVTDGIEGRLYVPIVLSQVPRKKTAP